MVAVGVVPASNPLDRLSEYEVRHLPAHLEEAGRFADLHSLLRLEWADPDSGGGQRRSRNAWFAARDRQGDLAGYLDDVRRAWRVAEQEATSELAEGRPAAHVGLEIRYALLSTSVRVLSERVAPHLLAALVEEGVWSLERAFARANSVADPAYRVEAVAALIPYLEEQRAAKVAEETFEAALGIRDDWPRARALTALAPRLPQPSIPGAVKGAETIEDARARSRVYAALAPRLPEPLLLKALEAAQEIDDHAKRSEALHELAGHLPERMKGFALEQAFAAADQALAAARGIQHWRVRAEALAGLVSAIRPEQKREVAEEAVDAARTDGDRTRIMVRLAPHLGGSVVANLADTVAQIVDGPAELVDAWLDLIPHLEEPFKGTVLERALTRAREVEHDYVRGKLLDKLVALLPPSGRAAVVEEALATRSRVGGRRERDQAVQVLAPHLPEPAKARALEEALEAALTWGYTDPPGLARALERLAPHLGEPLLVEALLRSGLLPSAEVRATALAVLATTLPEPPLTPALDQALSTAVRRAGEIEDPAARSKALAALGSRLSEPERSETLREAVRAMADLHVERARAGALVALAPVLPEPVLADALAIADALRDAEDRAKALSAVGAHLPEPRRSEVLSVALASARAIHYEGSRAELLTALAGHVPEPHRTQILREALVAASAIDHQGVRVSTLARMTPHLPEPERTQAVGVALTTATSIIDPGWRAKALADLSPHLPESLVTDALTGLRREPADHGSTNRWSRTQAVALAALAPHVPPQLAREAMETALAIESGWGDRLEALSALAPYLPKEVLNERWEEARRARDTQSSVALVRHVPPHLVRQALSAGEEIDRALGFALLNELAKTSPTGTELHDQWCKALAASANERPSLLLDVALLSSVVVALGGTTAVQEAVEAIREVDEWFP